MLQRDESGMDIGSFVRNDEWELIGAPVKFNEITYSCCPEPYQDVTFSVHLRRRTITYWRKFIIPSFTITAISLLTMLTPPTLPTPRFLIIFLLFILFVFTIPKDLPEVSILSSLLAWCYLTLFYIYITRTKIRSHMRSFVPRNVCVLLVIHTGVS